jgi:hypothetical protein
VAASDSKSFKQNDDKNLGWQGGFLSLLNNQHIAVEVPGNNVYRLTAKLPVKKGSKKLEIDISQGEIVYVDISTIGGTGKTTFFLFITLVRIVFCRIVKRELFADGKLEIFEANK